MTPERRSSSLATNQAQMEVGTSRTVRSCNPWPAQLIKHRIDPKHRWKVAHGLAVPIKHRNCCQDIEQLNTMASRFAVVAHRQPSMKVYMTDPATNWKMSDLETKACKVALLWQAACHEVFPDYYHGKGLPRKGDPRKSTLFRYAYKLVRETQGVIQDDEYQLYVRAQLIILRSIRIGDLHPLVGPNILVGDKAWIRWKVWKKKYKGITETSTLEDVGLDKTDEEKIVKELKSTKKFLEGRFGGPYGEPQIMMAKYDMERWVALEKVSPFYAVLSPWARKYCNFKNVFDEDLYQSSITPGIKGRFKELFAHEH